MDENNKSVQLRIQIIDEGDDFTITDDEAVELERLKNEPPTLSYRNLLLDEETTAKFLALPINERMAFFEKTLDDFYRKNKEYRHFVNEEIYSDPALLLDFFKSLTPEDFDAAGINAAATRYALLQRQIKEVERAIEITPIDTESLATMWPILEMQKLYNETEMAAFYYLKYPRQTAREQAINKGAIMSTGGRITDISHKDYSGWLDEVPNDSAYISYVGPRYWEGIEIDDGGNIYEGDEARVLRAVRDQDAKVKKAFKAGTFGSERPPEHERINKEVMRALLKATIAERGGIRTIYLPTFARELNENYRIDVDEYDDSGELNEKGKQSKEAAEQRAREAEQARARGEKVYTKEKPSIMQQFYSLDYWAGVLDRNDVTRTAVIVGLNKEAQTIDVVLPYIDKIRERMKEAREIEAAAHNRAYILPAYQDLVHSNMESERNKLAVDLVYTIIDKLMQRGSKPASDFKENQSEGDQIEEKATGEKVVYRVKYSTLINDTPLLAMAYKNANGSKREYDVLNRTFKKAFQLLRKKTDIYDYFTDLNIPDIPPTKRTINDLFVITHRGINPEYKKSK